MGSLFGVEITQRICYQMSRMSVCKRFAFLDGTPPWRLAWNRAWQIPPPPPVAA